MRNRQLLQTLLHSRWALFRYKRTQSPASGKNKRTRQGLRATDMNEFAVEKQNRNRLTKPPSNDHSSCSLVRTDANSSGVHATEISPYKVKDAKALLCQGRVLVVVGSSFGGEPVGPCP